MSRRHQSSRRRNYGKRQREVRQRRGGLSGDIDARLVELDWTLADVDDDRPNAGDSDGYGGLRP